MGSDDVPTTTSINALETGMLQSFASSLLIKYETLPDQHLYFPQINLYNLILLYWLSTFTWA